MSKDTWEGDTLRPETFNSWIYGEGNPINFIDPTGLCGEIYTGNIYLNASINQRCYELVQDFTNDAVTAGFKVDANEINKHNIDVIWALYLAWKDTNRQSQVILPPSGTLPVGQPFKVTMTFVAFPDPLQAYMDMVGAGLDVCSWVAIIPPFAPAIPPLQTVSFLLDGVSVIYQVSQSFDDGVVQLASIGADKATELGVEHSHLFGHQVGGLVPMIGLAFDAGALTDQYQRGSVLSVEPTSDWPDPSPDIPFIQPYSRRPSLINRGVSSVEIWKRGSIWMP